MTGGLDCYCLVASCTATEIELSFVPLCQCRGKMERKMRMLMRMRSKERPVFVFELHQIRQRGTCILS